MSNGTYFFAFSHSESQALPYQLKLIAICENLTSYASECDPLTSASIDLTGLLFPEIWPTCLYYDLPVFQNVSILKPFFWQKYASTLT
jgi:hypothetical protein